MAEKVLNSTPDPTAVGCPIPVRYVQLPTVWASLFKQYFSLPPGVDTRWMPSVSHLKYVDPQGDVQVPPTPLPVETDFPDMVEIGRLDEYFGDRLTDLPKILVRRGAVAKNKLGVADGRMISPAVSKKTGGNLFLHAYAFSVVTFAMSRDAGQADHLGAECEQLLSHFAHALRKEYDLNVLNISQAGEVGRLREFPNFFAVPIVADVQYTDVVQIVTGGMPLRHVNINFNIS